MNSLIKLARLVSEDEQRKLAEELRSKGLKVMSDPWAAKGRLIVEGKVPQGMKGITQEIPLYLDGKPTKTLGEVATEIASFAKVQGLDDFNISAHIFPGVPFHLRAVKERLKKKGFNLEGDTSVYLEARDAAGSVLIRLGVVEEERMPQRNDLVLVIESPKTPYEVADFIRLGIAFNMEVRISTEGDYRAVRAIEDAKGIAKGHDKTKIGVYRTTKDAIGGIPAVAFSLWGKDKMPELKGKAALVFGNEERGLMIDTLKLCAATVRLGPKSSEPMRASQAAAYALGSIHSSKSI